MSLTFDEFKDEATKVLNVKLDGYKIKRVQRRTDSLMRRHNINDYSQCLELLKDDPEFKAAYLGHFTINTSEFYRNPENFSFLQKKILPELFSDNKKVKIWSAPCSNGSEPYTIAIILNELNINPARYQILASDLDSEILEEARKGIYGQSSLKNVPGNLLEKYFKQIPGQSKFQLDSKIIDQVQFEKKDLINESFLQNWQLILSRNFFIYLTREIKKKLTRKFVSVLNPGGYFFLGNTEFIFNYQEYDLEKVNFSFYKKTN